MESPRPLVQKPEGAHGYFWTIWADWGLVAKSGFAFVAIVCLFTLASQYSAGDYQRESFQMALTSLSNVPLAQPITQRKAKLLKQGDLYSWRSILWIPEGGDIKPWIWQARILREDKSYRTVAVELEPYEAGKARSLELFDDVSNPPATAD